MQRRRNQRNSVARSAALLGLAFLFLPALALASQTNGTISSTDKYAWSNVGGWVNFAPSNSAVSITDSALTGYVWSANTGWINLAPSQGGVKNDGNGTLSGFAWDESEGWISFTGVTIDRSGVFHGVAIGANESITFDCANCLVRTDWRHYDTRFGLEGGGGSVSYGGGGGAGIANQSVSGSAAPTASSTNQDTPAQAAPTPPAQTSLPPTPRPPTVSAAGAAAIAEAVSGRAASAQPASPPLVATSSRIAPAVPHRSSTTTPHALRQLRLVAPIAGGAGLLFAIFFVLWTIL